MFVTPEYNRSIPGVLKNAIEHGIAAARQEFLPRQADLASSAIHRAHSVASVPQNTCKISCQGISGPILGQPEIYLNGVGDAFDDKGNLTKEPLQKVLQQYLGAFAALVERQNKITA